MPTHPSSTTPSAPPTAEEVRLQEDASRERNWKRWGPYLAERQWATVREDYSGTGDCWTYFPHDHARSRAYRWGEDGLLGITDRECRLCFALALWNHKDPILKERLFGLTGPEGNHGEDVKELYYYLESTPTHSYMKALYKYPQGEFPYERLVAENRRRTRRDPEFELEETGLFDESCYFDVIVEYAKADADDLLIRITLHNRGPDAAPLTVLPTLWFRNTWSWETPAGRPSDPAPARSSASSVNPENTGRPSIRRVSPATLQADHPTLGAMYLSVDGGAPEFLFTENETNSLRLFGTPNPAPFVKDAFHAAIVQNAAGVTNPQATGTKAAAVHRLQIPGGGHVTLRLRLAAKAPADARAPFENFDELFARRIGESDEFFAARLPRGSDHERRNVARQAYAGLLWSKQFYHYVVEDWLKGDQVPPAPGHSATRNHDWPHLYSRDILSMPDKWEYPWFAAWDLAFHMVALARVDGHFAKRQLELLLREWYMHPNGQIPAYEFAFSDVNPPVHAWAAWRVYKMTGPRGGRDVPFLERCFHKLMLNFTWWVNRKDLHGRHLFSGGFLGLDNIGIFDRSRPLPSGHCLEQADGTAWMAFYCSTMLAIALELAQHNPAYEDIASKFFEHFISIVDAINTLGGNGLWDEQDGFYYDHLRAENGVNTPLRVRSLVGLVPLFAVEIFEQRTLDRLPGFTRRMNWFLQNRQDLARNIACMQCDAGKKAERHERPHAHYLLAVPSRQRLERVLRYLLDESEFLSPFGIRSVSRIHKDRPFSLQLNGENFSVAYCPGESDTTLFGGNSNWRGPIWMPMNFLLIEALERYEHFYGDSLKIQLPSGESFTLQQAIDQLRQRIANLFLPAHGPAGTLQGRPCHGDNPLYTRPNWRHLLLFHEYFHPESGKGLGASHQTGWTALIATLLAPSGRHAGERNAAAGPRRAPAVPAR
jgi:hypothetical protein